jgi:hypothetical protein
MGKFGKLMKRFNYEASDKEEDWNYLYDFNKESYVKSVNFHDTLLNKDKTNTRLCMQIS